MKADIFGRYLYSIFNQFVLSVVPFRLYKILYPNHWIWRQFTINVSLDNNLGTSVIKPRSLKFDVLKNILKKKNNMKSADINTPTKFVWHVILFQFDL